MINNNETSLDVRELNDLARAFNATETILNKNYLRVLDKLEIEPINSTVASVDIERKSRFFKINKLIYNKNEDSLEKLTTVFNAVALANGSISTIIKSDGKRVDYYLGVINKGMESDIVTQYETLEGTFRGNFAGSEISVVSNSETKALTSDIFRNNEGNSDFVISSVSGVPSLRLEENKDSINYIQGLEKLTDSMQGKSYTVVLIADPISHEEINTIRAGYEQLYSDLVPFLKTQMTFNEGESLTLTEGETIGVTDTINTSVSYTQNHTETNGWSTSENEGTSKTTNYGGAFSSGAAVVGSILGSAIGPAGTLVGGAIGKAAGSVVGSLIGSTTTNKGISNSKNGSTSDSTGETQQSGQSTANSKQNNNSVSEGTNKGRSIQISYENRTVKSLLEKVDAQLERLKQCEGYGTFNLAAYFISNDTAVNRMGASAYNALMKGEDTSVEASVINTWTNRRDNKKISRYLEKLTHPSFKCYLNEDNYINVTPGTIISGKELSIQIALPKKSITGLPVVESVDFGRNVYSLNSSMGNVEEINLGKIYHMGQIENTPVSLNKKSLAMHTFVTGSTGSGKSNTIYSMLDELNKNDVKFLIVEPAKGEYKHVFGHRNDVTVLGTNHNFTDILKINPFKFSKSIHVLEHIDRLIEIFNVCWSMYAAMPAVLKEAVERAYELAGWDLSLSINKYNEDLYPTFADLLITLNDVINESAYSEELKGNYIGALVTRVKSLTNGINGIIFASDEIDNDILFDSNVIVDLSRVGSVETKSMIMGILVMRLSEHRMTQGGMNVNLKHITVLEEAHNILKRTSTEQSSEGSNLLGKSVEMISNAIAEMRTYGEGFIIADQSPGMLDMSAIRNTNTKIILRLPEQNDREAVGKAATLTDDQINELAKLETGVAAVYQNNWLEPLLCKVNKFNTEEIEYRKPSSLDLKGIKDLKARITKLLLCNHVSEKIDYNFEELSKIIVQANITSSIKTKVLDKLKGNNIDDLEEVSSIICLLYNYSGALEKAKKSSDFNEWNNIMLRNIEDINNIEIVYREAILQCILRETAKKESSFEKFYFDWTDYMRGRVL